MITKLNLYSVLLKSLKPVSVYGLNHDKQSWNSINTTIYRKNCYIFSCVRKCPFRKEHSMDFPPMCTREQWVFEAHEICFSLWVSICLFKFPWCENSLPHISHEWGLWAEWMNKCFFRFPLSVKHLPHTSHEYGFSPLCVVVCFCKFPCWLNAFPQMWQE